MGAVICYDCTDVNNFGNAETWLTEFRSKAKEDAPLILVATKKDLVNEKCVQSWKGEELANKFNARFMETSAYTGENVARVFH